MLAGRFRFRVYNDWLQAGFTLFRRPELFREQFLLHSFPSGDWSSGVKKHLSPEMLNVCIKKVLSELRAPLRGERIWRKGDVSLIAQELLPFWSGHSARHLVAVRAANLGVSSRTGLLGALAGRGT